MKKSQEIEIKFRVDGIGMRAMERRLRKAGFRKITPRTHEMNTLYDLPGQPLRRKSELLRLREYGKRWVLTHKGKGKVGRHKSRVETETGVEKGLKMDAILRHLGYAPIFRYEKFRSEWTDGTGHVVLDETPIGQLGEIEGPARWIDRTARSLGIARDKYMTAAYTELFFAWKRKTHSKAREMTFAAVKK